VCRQVRYPDDLYSCEGPGVIVLDRAAAHPDRTDQDAGLVDDRQAAGKRDEALVGVLDPEQGTARL
jgi:hypothetical protein